MLFNSTFFIFIFLPTVLTVLFVFNKLGWQRIAVFWLVLSSAFFYGWFSVHYLFMLIALILVNFSIGIKLSRDFHRGIKNRPLLALGIGIDLCALGYFKYVNFFIDNSNSLLGTSFLIQDVLLPIGISFFTFQKIAFLVDAFRGETEEYNLLDFSLFVMFFPQLIAGPIVHHKQVIPQFKALRNGGPSAVDLSCGLALFTIGMVKKVVIADTLVGWTDPIFSLANAGIVPTFYESWTATLAFTFQIYFDFSGYTDMALGLALMAGIRLPINFDSPYKATSIIDFWRRWHMTLSRFLKDYLYFSLGGGRRGQMRRYVNLLLTMLIGGLWHGASWTFVIWGGLHGLFLVLNHLFRRVSRWPNLLSSGFMIWVARLITFFAVAIAWVFFRSENFDAAIQMLLGMVGASGFGMPQTGNFVAQHLAGILNSLGVDPETDIVSQLLRLGTGRAAALGALMMFVFLAPNSQQLLAHARPCLQKVKAMELGKLMRRFLSAIRLIGPDGSIALNAVTGLMFAAMLVLIILFQWFSRTTLQPFTYFQF